MPGAAQRGASAVPGARGCAGGQSLRELAEVSAGVAGAAMCGPQGAADGTSQDVAQVVCPPEGDVYALLGARPRAPPPPRPRGGSLIPRIIWLYDHQRAHPRRLVPHQQPPWAQRPSAARRRRPAPTVQPYRLRCRARRRRRARARAGRRFVRRRR